MEASEQEAKAILQAAGTGDRKTLLGFIAEGKVGVVDEDSNTPLMCAAASGREEILRMLLDAECLAQNQLETEGGVRYVDLQNRYGWTALMQACCYGHSGAVVLLLQKGANVQLCNNWKASSLVLASQGGHFGVVHTLLNHGAKVDLEPDGQVSCTLTPLMAAAQCGHVEVVEELIRGGAVLEVSLKATNYTALMFAVLNNKPEVVNLLLKSGADKEVKDTRGKMPVELATSRGYYNIVRLLSGGVLTRNVSFSDSDFFEVVNKGEVEKVREMLALKPSLAGLQDKDGATPLMYASNKGHKEVCEALLEAKAEVNIKDKKYGWTALMHATHYKKYEVVELLGQYGADVNVRGNSGSTAYDIASMIGDIKMIKLIAKITVERIEKKPTPSGAQTTPSISVVDTPTQESPERQNKKSTQPLPFSELRSKIQMAYRSPPPKLTIPGNELENLSPQFPSHAPRFPSSRNSRPTALSNSSHSSTPSSNLRPTSAAKGPPSPSKSAGSFPSNKLSIKPAGPSPFPRVSPSVGAGPAGGKVGAPKAVNSAFGAGEERTALQKYRLKSPSRPFEGHMARTKPQGNIFSKNPTTARLTSHEGKGISKAKEARRRANTEPLSPTPFSWPSSRGRATGKQTDLKSVLEEASMAKYYSIFQEQEVDYDSFMSLTSGDLAEMGIADEQARAHLLALITQLNTASNDTNISSMGSDVFVFH